jgi:hypothetical protein
MEKMTYGIITISILAIVQISAWILNKDGAITASLSGLIGLICGSIFGFTVATAKKEDTSNK